MIKKPYYHLFNNNENALNCLLDYVEKCIPNWHCFLSENDYEIDFGLKHYISHYITLVLHCLFENVDSTKSQSFVDTEMKQNGFSKRDFEPFYELIRQFSVYNACCPRQDRNEEGFYLKRFAKC